MASYSGPSRAPILDALGIPRGGLHAFRHTHTALLLECRTSTKGVQGQLRYVEARTTLKLYGHVLGDAQRDAVEESGEEDAGKREIDNGRK